jgi:hypothetical protein
MPTHTWAPSTCQKSTLQTASIASRFGPRTYQNSDLFPSRPGDEPLVGVSLAPPMGWKDAAQIFTAATEMVADLTNQKLASGTTHDCHRLKDASQQAPPSPELPLYTPTADLVGPASLPPPDDVPDPPTTTVRLVSGTYTWMTFWGWSGATRTGGAMSNWHFSTLWIQLCDPSMPRTPSIGKSPLP